MTTLLPIFTPGGAAEQVESYLRTISSELRLLASDKMMVDAAREFRSTFSELEHNRIELSWRPSYLPGLRK